MYDSLSLTGHNDELLVVRRPGRGLDTRVDAADNVELASAGLNVNLAHHQTLGRTFKLEDCNVSSSEKHDDASVIGKVVDVDGLRGAGGQSKRSEHGGVEACHNLGPSALSLSHTLPHLECMTFLSHLGK